MDTFDNQQLRTDDQPVYADDQNPCQEAAPAEPAEPVQEPVTIQEEPTVPAAEPVPEAAPVQVPPVQDPAPQYAQPGYGYQQPQYGYYPPQYGQTGYCPPAYPNRPYTQPAPQPGYYQPRYVQSAYAEPGTRQNAYVPPRTESASAEHKLPAKPNKRKKGGFWKGFVSVILILALVGGSCFATAFLVNQHWEQKTNEMNSKLTAQIGQLQDQITANANANTGTIGGGYVPTGDYLTPAQVYANNVRSVVAITCSVTTSYYGQTTTGTSSGSGFIISADGYVVTNYHVVEGANSVTVTTNDGTNYTAAIVGGDSTNDIAVLKVEGNNLPAVTIGSSSSLIVGDQVAAVGNALGELTNSLTVGYISAKDRMITTDGFGINMLQTDTAINSGNSGGPLFNMYGEVVGITTAKYSGESSSGASIEGIGFAIPIDDVVGLIDDLISKGYIGGAYLGVMVSDVNAEVASYYGFPVGAYVQEATLGYCAARAGIQAKDIIVDLGGYPINGVTALTRALRNFSAGETTTVTVYRNGTYLELTITLDEKPQE